MLILVPKMLIFEMLGFTVIYLSIQILIIPFFLFHFIFFIEHNLLH